MPIMTEKEAMVAALVTANAEVTGVPALSARPA